MPLSGCDGALKTRRNTQEGEVSVTADSMPQAVIECVGLAFRWSDPFRSFAGSMRSNWPRGEDIEAQGGSASLLIGSLFVVIRLQD
jgi:hypothetical protein